MTRKPKRKSRIQLPVLDACQRYNVNEASALLRQSRAKTFVDIRNGTIKIIKDGARTYIPGSEIISRSTLGGSSMSA